MVQGNITDKRYCSGIKKTSNRKSNGESECEHEWMDDNVNEMDDCVNEMDDCETYNKILLWSERKAGVIEWTALTKVVEFAIQDLPL